MLDGARDLQISRLFLNLSEAKPWNFSLMNHALIKGMYYKQEDVVNSNPYAATEASLSFTNILQALIIRHSIIGNICYVFRFAEGLICA